MTLVAKLECQPRGDLISQYEQIVGTPPPKYLSLSILAHVIVYEAQAAELCALPARVRKQLRTVVEQGRAVPPACTLKSDARLVREWNGISHVVDRVEGGFAYRGKTYRSLSAIAKEITGAKWSGPRFFGLKGAA